MIDREALFERIMDAINRRYGSRKAFAEANGIPVATVYKLKTADSLSSVSLMTIERICNALEIDLDTDVNPDKEELYQKYKKHPEMQKAVNKLLEDCPLYIRK